MTPADSDRPATAPLAHRPHRPRVTKELIDFHARRAHRLRRRAMNAALRAAGRHIVNLARRTARLLTGRNLMRRPDLRRIAAARM